LEEGSREFERAREEATSIKKKNRTQKREKKGYLRPKLGARGRRKPRVLLSERVQP
jgi:hypothetical protein